MSFTIAAPLPIAVSATSRLYVSMETRCPSPTSAATTGPAIAASTSASSCGRLARAVSAPTSMMSAPSKRSRSAWASAAVTSVPTPSPEKESSVRFTIPITRGSSSASSCGPARQCSTGDR